MQLATELQAGGTYSVVGGMFIAMEPNAVAQ